MTIREDLETVRYFAGKFWEILVNVPGAIAYGIGEMREEYGFRAQMHEENCRIWTQRREMTKESTRIRKNYEGEDSKDNLWV